VDELLRRRKRGTDLAFSFKGYIGHVKFSYGVFCLLHILDFGLH